MRKILLAFLVILIASSAFGAGVYTIDEDEILYLDGVEVDQKKIHGIGETIWEWVNTDEGILIFNPEYFDDTAIYVQLRENEECLDVALTFHDEGFVLVLSSNNIAMIDTTGKIRFRTPGTGPLLKMDEYRYAFTSLKPGQRRGRGKNAKLWSGVSVFEFFTDDKGNLTEFYVEPVCEPNALTDYKLLRVDNYIDELIIMQESVTSPAEWNKAKPKIDEQEMSVEFPAAG